MMSLFLSISNDFVEVIDFFTGMSLSDFWILQYELFLFPMLVGISGLTIGCNKAIGSKVNILSVLFFIYSLGVCFFLNKSMVSNNVYSLIALFLFFIIIQSVFFDLKFIKRFCIFLLILAVVQGVYCLLQFSGIMISKNSFYLVTGSFMNPALLGIFLSLGFLISVYLSILEFSKPYLRSGLIIVSGFILIALFLCNSRAALFSTFVSLVFLGWKLNKSKPFFLQKKLRLGAYLIGIILMIVSIFFVLKPNHDSISGRFLIWKISFNIFLDHPILGIGYGNYVVEYSKYQSAYFQKYEFSNEEIRVAGVVNYAFNEPLEILVENGLIGFSLFIGIVINSLMVLYRRGNYNSIFHLLFSILLSIICFSLFSYPFHDIKILLVFWTIIAISSVVDVGKVFALNFVLQLIITGFCVSLTYKSVENLLAIKKWKKGYELSIYSENDSKELYTQVFPILNNDPEYLYNYFSVLMDWGDYTKSLKIGKLACLYINNVDLHLLLGANYLALGDFYKSENEYKIAHSMHPSLYTPLEKLFDLFVLRGDVRSAHKVSKKVISMPVKIKSLEVERIKLKCQFFLNNNL